MKLTINLEQYGAEMRDRGWCILYEAIDTGLLTHMIEDLNRAWDICRTIQMRNGVASDADLTVHHLLGQGPSFMDFIDGMEPLMPYF